MQYDLQPAFPVKGTQKHLKHLLAMHLKQDLGLEIVSNSLRS